MQVQVKPKKLKLKFVRVRLLSWMKYFANKRAAAHETATGLNTVEVLHRKSVPVTVFTSSN